MNTPPMGRSRSRRLLPTAIIVTLLGSLALSGCRSSDSIYDPPEPPDYAAELEGSPAPLAALHRQGNQLLEGGEEAFRARLADLEGFPVVVNVWASWCGPCREEFPLLQKASAANGREVAFLGVDSQDDADAAATFLKDFPVPYPSYRDPDGSIASSLAADRGLPVTVIFDRSGRQTHVRYGPYREQDEFEAELRQYGLDPGAAG